MANFGNFITKYIVRPLYPAPAPVQLPVIMTDIILASSPTDLRPKATHHSQSWVECSRENAREGVHSGTGTADENVASYLTKMERSNVSESVLHSHMALFTGIVSVSYSAAAMYTSRRRCLGHVHIYATLASSVLANATHIRREPVTFADIRPSPSVNHSAQVPIAALGPNPSRYSSRTPLLPPLRCLLGLQTGDLRGHPTLTLPERRSLGVDLSRTPSLETHYITVLLFSAYERWPQVFYFFMTGLAPLLTILLRSSTDSNQRRSRLPRVVSDTHLVLLVIYLKPYPSQTKLIVGFAISAILPSPRRTVVNWGRIFLNNPAAPCACPRCSQIVCEGVYAKGYSEISQSGSSFGVRVSSHKSSGVYRALRASQLFTSSTSCFRTTMATNDDSGYIYENLRAPANLYDDFKDGNITYADLRPFIDVKWGYTNELPRRRREYRRCEYGHQRDHLAGILQGTTSCSRWYVHFHLLIPPHFGLTPGQSVGCMMPSAPWSRLWCTPALDAVFGIGIYPLEEILAEGSGAHDSHSKSRLERRANGDDANPSSSSTASSPRCAPDYSPDVLPADRNYEVEIGLDNVRAGPPRTARQVGSRNAMDGACIRPAASAEARAYSPVVRFRQVYPEVNLGVYLRVHLQVHPPVKRKDGFSVTLSSIQVRIKTGKIRFFLAKGGD
ncbi:hypothetical protein C8R43DRAFT_1131416 [Mycena crocata]|nr:hypothetical protein C8R43DRAFT_1131416 [Mycena crocata]